MNTWPFATPGAPLAPSSPLPRPGHGTRLTANALGYSVSTPEGGASFDHPWRPSLSGSRLSLRRGTVYSTGGDGVFEPKIKVNGTLVPMSGEPGEPAPVLTLEPNIANSADESWVALEVEPNEDGELVKKSRIEIVHTRTVLSHARSPGRHPLALILWRKGRPFRVLAITHFNLRYVRSVDTVGTRHFFL